MRLEAQALTKRFGRRVLFDNLSFSLEGGHALAITGMNGAGKSTLVRILAGVMRATRGEVTLEVNGAAVPAEERMFAVGMVAPYLNVYEGFTARENLAFIAKARRLPKAQQRVAAVLADVQLARRADDLVSTYSSGMKQRVRFAAALLMDPPVLLLDEPSSNLDAPGKKMVDQVMTAQVERGRILVVATNDADEAARCEAQLNIQDYR